MPTNTPQQPALPDIDISSIGDASAPSPGTKRPALVIPPGAPRYPSVFLLSHSSRESFYSCPRKFMLAKAMPERSREDTISTIFGKAVGVGIQALCSGNTLDSALLATLLAWEWPLDHIDEGGTRSKKSPWYACQAVEAFYHQHLPDIGAEWEIFTLPNGRPSTEVAFRISMPGGSYERGYIDVVLQHKVTKQLAVIELKTTGLPQGDGGGSIMYANSGQGTSYGVIVDYLATQMGIESNLMVFYITLYTKSQTWELYPFTKPESSRLQWLRGLRQEHDMVSHCHDLENWPMRGSSCNSWGRPCFAFGICDLQDSLHNVPSIHDTMEYQDNGFAIEADWHDLVAMYLPS
jgi:hypothetical protein